MALKLKGSTSGFVGLDAPSVAGNNTLILPTSAGSAHQILANDITAGVTTFTQVTVSRNGDLTVPGTISIGGTLTYEDVTSVDSVGIVTARGLSIFGNTTGLQVASGISTFQAITGTTGTFTGNIAVSGANITLQDSGGASDDRIQIGASQDLELYHSGSHSFIEHSGTGHLILGGVPNGNNVDIMKAGYSEYMARFKPDSSVDLYYDANVKFQTTSSGVTVTGSLIASSSVTTTDQNTFSGGLKTGTDEYKIKLGASDDLELWHSSNSNSYIKNSTGQLFIASDNIALKTTDQSETFIDCNGNGNVELYYNNSKKIETTDTGVRIPDSQKYEVGAGADLMLFHNGTNNYIRSENGTLYIDSSGGEQMVTAIPNGAVELYHNGLKKLSTNTNGAQIHAEEGGGATLILTSDEGDDNADNWRLHANPNHSFILQNYASGSYEDSIVATGNGAVDLYYDNLKVLSTIDKGIKLHNGGFSQIKFFDVNTSTISMYTNSVNLRWYDDVNSDNIMQLSQNGDLNIDGSYSNSGVDYAEYFESTDGSAIPIGTTVVLDSGKVRAATSSETPIGVIRPKTSGTSVTGGVNQLNWQGKYLVDDYDGQLMESAVHCTWTDDNEDEQQCWKDRPPTGVTIPSDAVETTVERPQLNPSFDESKTYVPRSERDEWNCVGLLGQIPITKGQPTSSNWIKMKDRSATVELWMVK